MCNLRAVFAAASVVGLLPVTVIAAPSPAEKTLINTTVTAALKEFNIPGAALAVETDGTRWMRSFGYAGYAGRRAVTPGDYFAIRSITKSFVVTALMQQIAGSKVAMALDDTIGKYIPNVPNGDIITLRQLANMTSGLYNYHR